MISKADSVRVSAPAIISNNLGVPSGNAATRHFTCHLAALMPLQQRLHCVRELLALEKVDTQYC